MKRQGSVDEGLLDRVADAFHSRECTVYDGRRAVSSCRGRDRDRAIAERAIWDVTAAIRPGEALFSDGLRHQRTTPTKGTTARG